MCDEILRLGFNLEDGLHYFKAFITFITITFLRHSKLPLSKCKYRISSLHGDHHAEIEPQWDLILLLLNFVTCLF